VTCPHSVLRYVLHPRASAWPAVCRTRCSQAFVIGQEHAVILTAPPLAAVSPVDTGQVQDLPQRHHFIRFGHRFSRILIEKKFSPLFVDGRLHFGEFGLGLLVLFQHILDHEYKVIGGGPHGTAAFVAQGHVAGPQNTIRSLFARNLGPGVVDQLWNVDLHGADIDAPLAHGAHPYPGTAQNFLVQAQGGHSQKFARIHSLQTRGRTARRTGTAGQTQVEIAALRQNLLNLVDKQTLLSFFQFDYLFEHGLLLFLMIRIGSYLSFFEMNIAKFPVAFFFEDKFIG
jgi:hypothetical protein